MIKKTLLLFCIVASFHLNAQTGIGTTTPHASAKLEVNATNKGFLPPRIALLSATDVATIASPATGLVIFNTATAGTSPNNVLPGYYYWDGSRWNGLVAQTALQSFSGYTPNYAQSNASSVTKSAVGDVVISQSITTSGRPVQIIATGDANPTSAGAWVQLQLYRDGTAIGKKIQAESSSSNENVPYCLNFIDNPTAGTYTYSVKITAGSGANFQFGEADGNQLTLLELGAWSAGTMPVSKGGTGNSSYTSGSVLFSDGTSIAQNNSKLYWDNTNNRLGLGTNTPTFTLDVNGTAKLQTTPSITTATNVLVKDPTTSQISEQPISFINGIAKFIRNATQTSITNGSTVILNATTVNSITSYASLNTSTGVITLQPGTYELNGTSGSGYAANGSGDSRSYTLFHNGTSYIGTGGVTESGPAGNYNTMPQNTANCVIVVPVGQTATISLRLVSAVNMGGISSSGDFGDVADAGRAWVTVRKYN